MSGRPIDDAMYELIERLIAFADARDRTIADVAIGALIANPVVGSVITGATKPTQIIANAAASSWTPGVEDLAELASILTPGASSAH